MYLVIITIMVYLDRLASVMPSAHWAPEKANSEEYLYVPIHCAKVYAPIRDKYAADTEMWVTESGDAGGGGDTWASTYLDVLRTLNELAGFSTVSNGVIFHNTLAASDYGFWLVKSLIHVQIILRCSCGIA